VSEAELIWATPVPLFPPGVGQQFRVGIRLFLRGGEVVELEIGNN